MEKENIVFKCNIYLIIKEFEICMLELEYGREVVELVFN